MASGSSRILVAILLGLALAHAAVSSPWLPTHGSVHPQSSLVYIAHDSGMPLDEPLVRRLAGHVSALGRTGADSHLYAFETAALQRDAARFPPGSLRSWRLTFVSGERLGAVFRIADNTNSQIVVTTAGDPLDGIAVGDAFLIEDRIERTPPARR